MVMKCYQRCIPTSSIFFPSRPVRLFPVLRPLRASRPLAPEAGRVTVCRSRGTVWQQRDEKGRVLTRPWIHATATGRARRGRFRAESGGGGTRMSNGSTEPQRLTVRLGAPFPEVHQFPSGGSL